MANFKDDLNEDIPTFLNLEEFSEPLVVDGLEITCQVVHWTADKSNRQNETYAGLHGDFTTIFFRTSDYTSQRERLPRHGEQIYLRGRRYDVISVKDEMGITKIVCSAYRQNTLRSTPFDGSVNPYGQLVQ